MAIAVMACGAQGAGVVPEPTAEDLMARAIEDLALPDTVLQSGAVLGARRATVWRSGDQFRVLLDKQTDIAIGAYRFRAERAVAMIDTDRSGPTPIHQLAIYLDQVRDVGGAGTINAVAPRLLVTASVSGKVELKTDLVKREALDEAPLVRDAVARVERYRKSLTEVATGAVEPPAQEPGPSAPTTTPPVQPDDAAPTEPATTDAQPDQTEEVRALTGRMHVNADRVVYRGEDEEPTIVLTGGARLMYVDRDLGRTFTLRAEHAVVFLDKSKLTGDTAELKAEAVTGVYLEGHVIATDGEYTLQSPKMYYDLRTDRAAMVDAVFYTWDVTQQVPIYLRARELRQESRRRWTATDAKLTTSEFHEPHFSIGVDRLTIARREKSDGTVAHRVDARGATANIGSLPVFYWPRAAGDATDTPIRSARLSISSHDGPTVKTEWDLFKLLGGEAPDGVYGGFLIDGYMKRGVGVGAKLDYDVPKAFGQFNSYLVYDTGTDRPSGREELEPQTNTRGQVKWRHRHNLANGWEISLELGYISDPTFLEEYFQSDAYNDKPFETSIYAKQQVEDWAFTFLLKHDLLDFVPNLNQLQTPGYTVDKLPELAYYRIATPLLGNRLTWYSENRASAMRLRMPEQTPRQLGFNAAESVALLGMTQDTRLDVDLHNRGYPDQPHYRFDTRQEFVLPMKAGPIDVAPFVVGRLTAYDENFDRFGPNNDQDTVRLWGMMGVRLHTALHRTYEQVDSRLLDLHRLRHIVEPSVTVSYAATNLRQDDLPVYDYDVESLAEGTTIRLGLRNTFQTQRGGPGRWRSVDFLRVETDFVIQSDETQIESPVSRFINHRPELSLGGDHFWSEVAWQLTDTTDLVSNVNYSFESDRVEQWNIGLAMQHNPRLGSFVESRFIESLDTHVVRYGVDYLLTRKYHVSVSQSFDLDRDKSRDVSLVLTRRLPRWLLIVAMDFDTIGDEQTFGIALVPEGFGGGRTAPQANPFMSE